MGPASKRARVIVTRARESAGPLVARLVSLGLDVVACPLIELEATGPSEIDTTAYDWAVVTSARGAHELARCRRDELAKDLTIGPGRTATLRDHGIEPAL